MRKRAYASFAALSLFLAHSALAGGYEPLVAIPGVDEGEVDIAKYLIGIYNFLLSIVGIVAVVMLILGGMKYITAAGNSGTVQAAKNSIKDALFGLILALLSYVIVGTINPDVLYLRQPGASFLKENITTSSVQGYWTTNADGTLTYTSPEGYQRRMSPETAEQVKSGEMPIVFTSGEKVEAMKKYLSCIIPGTPKDSNDPTYRNTCNCVGGDIKLAQGTVNCNTACENANKCGYKFLSVKLNARHGYTQQDGSIGESNGSGDAATGTTGTLPEYDLTSDTQVHADELWELHGTNDPTWGDFNIVYDTTETTQSAEGPDIVTQLDQPKKYVTTGTELYPCALMITNEQEFAPDQHYVYWVPLGTVVGKANSTLYADIKDGYQGGCQQGGGYYGISTGTCDQAWTDRVMLAKYSDDIIDRCDYCKLADEGSLGKAYRFSRTLTCRSGYWQ